MLNCEKETIILFNEEESVVNRCKYLYIQRADEAQAGELCRGISGALQVGQ